MEEDGVAFVPWGQIKLFHNLVKHFTVSIRTKFFQDPTHNGYDYGADGDTEDSDFPLIINSIQKPVIYKGKVKLHGQNAGLTLEGHHLKAQSRNRFIGETGFGSLVYGKNRSYFKSLIPKTGRMTFFGEFCGPKIQKGVALTELKRDIFAVFAIDIDSKLIIEPEHILQVMTKQGRLQLPSDVYILPWHGNQEGFSIDFMPVVSGTGQGQIEALEQIEEQVNEIDQLDPWVKSNFGIEGPGEGLVLYPVSLQEDSPEIPGYKSLTKQAFECFAFKAKGEQHRGVATKKSVQMQADVVSGADAYADLMCPVPRLEQGADEVGGYQFSKMKAFLEWVVKDVQKEGKDELAASGLEWKEVTNAIIKKASAWYKAKAKFQMFTFK